MNKEIITFRSSGMIDIEPAIIATDKRTGIKYFGTMDFANGSKIKWEKVKFVDDINIFETEKIEKLKQHKAVNSEASDMLKEIYGIDKTPIRGQTKDLIFIDDCAFDVDNDKGEAIFNDL